VEINLILCFKNDKNSNKKDCIGCGMCVSVNPDIFEIGDSGTAVVKSGQENESEGAQEAIQMCPVQAIIIENLNLNRKNQKFNKNDKSIGC